MTPAVKEAIQRGLTVALEIEEHRLSLEAALRGLYRIGGPAGMEAAALSAVIRIKQSPRG